MKKKYLRPEIEVFAVEEESYLLDLSRTLPAKVTDQQEDEELDEENAPFTF